MLHDVIIVGAGPAGSTCARECAKQGLSTLLLDRDSFPRPKPCGGAVSQQALSLLDGPLPREIIRQECFGARVHFRGRVTELRKDRRIAVLVDRAQFDGYLADRAVEAGATFQQRETVTGIEVGRDSVKLTTATGSYEGSFVVGADGANSAIGRTLRPPYPRQEIMAALVGTARASGDNADTCPPDLLEMHFGIAPLGYGWVFRGPAAASVGVMGLASEFPRAQACLADYSRSLGLAVEGIRGHTIPMGGFERPIASRRILLVGDAAGFADPFHGEGIMQALRSGKLAAQALADGVRGRKDAAAWYTGECQRLIVREMRIALAMARSLGRYPRLFLEMFFTGGPALDRYLDIAAGTSDYVRLRRWLLPRLPGYLLRTLSRGPFGTREH